MGTLADLVGGFQSGYTGVQDSRRRRKLNQAIDFELGSLEESRIGRQAGRERLGYGAGYEGAEFKMPQTWGEKLVGKVKSMFGGSTGQQNVTAIDPAMQPQGIQQPEGATTFPMPERFKDGGAVRNMKGYANGGRSLRPDQATAHGASRYHVENPLPGYTDGGGVGAPPGQMTPQNMGAVAIPTPNRMQMSQQMGQALPGFADGGMGSRLAELDAKQAKIEKARLAAEKKANPGLARRVGQGARKLVNKAPKGAAPLALGVTAADTATTSTEDYRERFALPRETGGDLPDEQMGDEWYSALGDKEFWSDVGIRGIGAASDLGNALSFGAASNLYRDKQDDKGQAISAALGPEADQPVAPEGAAQPAGDPPNTQTPQAQAAAQPAGPPEEIVDFTDPTYRDIDPQDMPNHGVADWEDERRFWAAQAISLGNDPFEAMKAVDARQMRGFSSYGQQAFQMLQNGDATGAARAMYAAYQYFPNGADVKFGVQKGVNGQPVLIGMGTDEKTGEPLKDGKPMVVTPESLSVQLENLTNPSAFRTWTKDWRSAEQEIREYNEVTKKEAESNARYRDRAGQAALMNASANYNESVTGGVGGLKQTDKDRANSAFMEAVSLEGFTDQAKADMMMDVMSQIYQKENGRTPYTTVIRDVRDAIRSGDFDGLDQKYGQ